MTAPDSSFEEIRPLSSGELRRIVADRFARNGRGLWITGGRTALPPVPSVAASADVLSTTGLSRIVEYPADDMTITVESGLRVEELQQTLAQHNQRLPIDIPQARRATIGGAVAANTSGPGRYGHGTFRDYLIGVKGVDGQGREFSAGGRVVKNVAGYDLCKLLVGSRGELAVITELTFKLWPRAAVRQMLWAAYDDFDAVEHALAGLLNSQARPIAIELLNPPAAAQMAQETRLDLPAPAAALCVACEGTAVETKWQLETLAAELAGGAAQLLELSSDDSQRLWASLSEHPCGSDEPATLRAALRPSKVVEWSRLATDLGAAVQCHAGNGIAIAHLPDHCTTADAAGKVTAPLRTMALRADGSLQIERCDPAWVDRLTPPAAETPAARLRQQLKQALDPRGVFHSRRS